MFRHSRSCVLASLLLAAACDNPVGGSGDGAPPTLTLYTPAAAAVVESDTVVVQGLAEDDEGVKRVSYRLNGGAEESVQVQPSKSVFFTFVLRDLKLGTNELEVLTYDAADRSTARKVGFSTRDLVAPVVEVQSLRDGELVGRDSVRVAGVARDGMQVASVTYALDGGAEQPVPITPGKQAGFGFTLRGTAPGEHALVLRARDQAGNTSAQTTRFSVASVVVELTSPSRDTTVTRFALDLQGRVQHDAPLSRLTASVNGGGEVLLCQSQRGSPACDFEAAGTHPFVVPLDSLVNGPAAVALYAYDRQGRKVGAATRTLAVAAPVKQYALAYLGVGGTDSQGTELNDAGQVVGWRLGSAGVEQAFAWDGARVIDLGEGLGATRSRAMGINRSGEVVGMFQTPECWRAFHYRLGQTGGASRLVDACGYRGMDVNDAGKALLYFEGSGGSGAAILDAGTLRPLQAGSRQIVGALRINNRDRVLGLLYDSYYVGVPAWLSLDAPPQGLGVYYPADLNDAGHVPFQITGPLSASGDSRPAYLLADRERSIESPGRYRTTPKGINDRDQVVGTYVRAVRAYSPGVAVQVNHPFLWENGTTWSVEFGDPAWQVDDVVDVNEGGVILAHGRNARTGQTGVVLLTPKG